MKKILALVLAALVVFSVVACGTKVDYKDAPTFEAALNSGEDVVGKTVQFKVDDFKSGTLLGCVLQAGEHLNFVSSELPGIKAGETATVKVTKVENMLGSWIIRYEKVK